MPESEDVVAAPYGVLAGAALTPGCYGWAPQFLAEMVRERRLLAAEEAVRRLTSLPAGGFGLQRRGRLAEGDWAAVVVWDLGRGGRDSTLPAFARFPSGIVHLRGTG